ncbi:unnamed protein product [Paramecium sonneborni]|uniref:Uncharacterized protein n=1 Tax=Paramecium sonneborni TaxID=65129 RepID=A0A8S1QB08_9CILI|nr:unnamed protein product [Paramecium sonneborni]
MNEDIVSDKFQSKFGSKMSNLVNIILNSGKDSNKFKKILPRLSITESLNQSKMIPRSRILSLNNEANGFITSRIELTNNSGDFYYKALNHQTYSIRHQKERMKDSIEKSVEGSPSVHSYQTTKVIETCQEVQIPLQVGVNQIKEKLEPIKVPR